METCQPAGGWWFYSLLINIRRGVSVDAWSVVIGWFAVEQLASVAVSATPIELNRKLFAKERKPGRGLRMYWTHKCRDSV